MSSSFLTRVIAIAAIAAPLVLSAAENPKCTDEAKRLQKAEDTYEKANEALRNLDTEYNSIIDQLPLWNAQLLLACGANEPLIEAQSACENFTVPSSSRYCPRKFKAKRVRIVRVDENASDRAKARLCKNFKRSMGTFLTRGYCKPLACNDLKTKGVTEAAAAAETELGAARRALAQCEQGATATVVTFEEIQLGTKYPLGQGFNSGPIKVEIEPLKYRDGTQSGNSSDWQPVAEVMVPWFVNGDEAVPQDSGFTELSLYPGNVNAKFSWSGCATEINFSVWDGGGDTNIGVNGSVVSQQGIFYAMTQRIAGAEVTVSNVGNTNHFAKVAIKSGDSCIRSFTIGGQESLIDSVTIKGNISAAN